MSSSGEAAAAAAASTFFNFDFDYDTTATKLPVIWSKRVGKEIKQLQKQFMLKTCTARGTAEYSEDGRQCSDAVSLVGMRCTPPARASRRCHTNAQASTIDDATVSLIQHSSCTAIGSRIAGVGDAVWTGCGSLRTTEYNHVRA